MSGKHEVPRIRAASQAKNLFSLTGSLASIFDRFRRVAQQPKGEFMPKDIGLPKHLRPRREKMFGHGRAAPLDRNAKARIIVYAKAWSARHKQPGQRRRDRPRGHRATRQGWERLVFSNAQYQRGSGGHARGRDGGDHGGGQHQSRDDAWPDRTG